MDFQLFQQFGSLLRRRWLPASLVLVLVLLCTAAFTFTQTPVYEAGSTLLFKRASAATSLGLSAGAGPSETAPFVQQGNPVETQSEILQSPPLLEKVVAAQQLKDAGGKALSVDRFLQDLKVASVKGTDLLKVSYQDEDPRRAERVVSSLIAFYRENDVATNRAEAAEARKFIYQQLPRVEATLRQRELALRDFKLKHRIVDLTEEARAGVSLVSNLDNELAQARARLQSTSTRLGELRHIVGMSAGRAMTTSALSQSPAVQEALTQLQTTQSQLAQARSRYQEVHPTVVNLKSKEASLKSLLERRVEQVVGSRIPSAQVGNSLQVGTLKQKLIDDLVNTEVDRLGASSQVAALAGVQNTYRQRILTLPTLAQGQQELERQLKATQSTYETLSRRLQEIRVTENQKVDDVRVVVPAVAYADPVAPKKGLNLAVGGFLGSLAAVAFALFLEAKDQSLKTVKEVKGQFGYPLFGTIPLMTRKTLLLEAPVGLLAEPVPQATRKGYALPPPKPERGLLPTPLGQTFGIIQASLQIANPGLKVLVVGSCLPGEGKSTVSLNLALALARLKHRVLLVDADLYRPSQHALWKLSNTPGLSGVLRGECPISQAAQPGVDHLDVLTAGVAMDYPLALINSSAMAMLIDQLRTLYDYIVIDTPPILETADALTLGKLGDGFLLVVRPGISDTTTAASGRALLDRTGQHVLGQIVNGVINTNEPGSGYARGYYYAGDSGTADH